MYTFFYVTNILIDSIKEFFNELFSFTSNITGALALAFLVVIIVSAFNKGISKKFFINNRKFIAITLILEIVSSITSSDINLIRVNIVAICVCIFLIIYKPIIKNKKKERKVVDAKFEKKGTRKK